MTKKKSLFQRKRNEYFYSYVLFNKKEDRTFAFRLKLVTEYIEVSKK